MARIWSDLQNNIFDFVSNGKGSAIVTAVAGSGKSTTVENAAKLVRGTSIVLAFNKAIAEEMKGRGVNARTFHSVTYMPVTQAKKAGTVDMDKLKNICKNWLDRDDQRKYGYFIQRLVGLARQTGIGCLVDDEPQAWQDIVDHHDLELEATDARMHTAIDLARQLLVISNKSKSVDFDDLLYFAVMENIRLPRFDVVFVDEAQDTNAIQRAIIKMMLKPGGRVIAVGDPAQAIYGFRGADSDSIELIKQAFNCIELPLSISYRCPKAVVNYARQWVSHIQHTDVAEDGAVNEMGKTWKNSMFACGDLVVCRRTAPLVELCFSLIRDRVGAKVLGKDIGTGLKTLIRRMEPKSIDGLMDRLEKWVAKEERRLQDEDKPEKLQVIRDRVDTIRALVDGLGQSERTINGLLKCIDEMFSDNENSCVILATIHKSKGLEADRVFWLDRAGCPANWSSKPWQVQQEKNLCYVATTRAKKALFTIELK